LGRKDIDGHGKKGKEIEKEEDEKGKEKHFFGGVGQWIILFVVIEISGFWTRYFIMSHVKKKIEEK